MDSVLVSAARAFNRDRHLVSLLLDGEWVAMYDEHGGVLEGIRGKAGAYAPRDLAKAFPGFDLPPGLEEELGVDLLELLPGASFPLHTHPGDHILIGQAGAGIIRVDGTRYPIIPGGTIFVAAEQVHGVSTFSDRQEVQAAAGAGPLWTHSLQAWDESAGNALRIWAVGVPHKHVESHDRMVLEPDDGGHDEPFAP